MLFFHAPVESTTPEYGITLFQFLDITCRLVVFYIFYFVNKLFVCNNVVYL